MLPFMIAAPPCLECVTAPRFTIVPSRPENSFASLSVNSVLATALEHCERAGLRVVITAPTDVHTFSNGITRFPERLIEPTAHTRYTRLYRAFDHNVDPVQDRGSWRVLVLDSRGRIIGALTARFFCGEVSREHVHALSLVAGPPSNFRTECELAIGETFSRAQRYARTPAEISHWSVAESRHARLVTVTLFRAMMALGVAFDLPVTLFAAAHEHGALARFMRWATAPLGRQGRHYLPPFVYRAERRLRLLVLDTSALGSRLRGAAIDLGVLRQRCSIISLQ
jgi:hypothetical protein